MTQPTTLHFLHPSELHESEDNPRFIRDDRFEALCQAVAKDPDMLLARPIIADVDEGGEIVAGHMRHRAIVHVLEEDRGTALHDRLEEWGGIPTYLRSFDAATKREWKLRDNAPYGDWVPDELAALIAQHKAEGGDMAMLGQEDDAIEEALRALDDGKTERGEPGDDLEPPDDPVSKPGEAYALGEHVLIIGSMASRITMEIVDFHLNQIGQRSPLIFTSPPYAVGVEYGEQKDDLDNLRPLLRALAGSWPSFLRDGGYCVVNFGDIIAASANGIVDVDEPCEYPMALEHWPIFREAGWLLDTRRCWAKVHARVHSPWAIQSNRAASDWEHLWTWRRPGEPKPREQRQHSARGVWDTVQLEGWDHVEQAHPAAFSRALARLVMKVYSDEGDVVLDPFGGSGTTLIAAEEIGRRAVIVELEPRWADVTLRRWREWTETEPTLLAAGPGTEADRMQSVGP